MKTALCTRCARTLVQVGQADLRGAVLAKRVQKQRPQKAKATMTSLRSSVFYARFARSRSKLNLFAPFGMLCTSVLAAKGFTTTI